MTLITRKACRASVLLTSQSSTSSRLATSLTPALRSLHTTPTPEATPVPHPIAPGPPPKPPTPLDPPTDTRTDRIDRKRRNAELLERGRNLRVHESKPGNALQKRFWKEVHVHKVSGESYEETGYQIYLDKRPVRTPSKHVLTIPPSKPHLASGIALEWDLLVSAQQALKHHYIPLTSLTSRALDIAAADQAGDARVRESIVRMLMGYLTTDTLLCWAPEADPEDPSQKANAQAQADMGKGTAHPSGKTLHELQKEVALPIIAYLTSHVWPGVAITPALEGGAIMPTPQAEETNNVIRGWVSGLGAWDLAGLERACLATKSLCVATRLVVEWSGMYASDRQVRDAGDTKRFGIHDAAEACSQEVRWQTGMWGEVEDTHDVEKEDLRRQLGSTILLIHDEGR